METRHFLAFLSKFCDRTGIVPLPPLRTALSRRTRSRGLLGDHSISKFDT